MSVIPGWGRVVAQPHEFLVHQRNGKLKTTGQGASCFKWPSDSVALVSTSLSKLSFMADQVTLEKVGVEVTGLAVYRVVEPMIAYRMLDGDQGKLAEVLRDMFVGATRRIVASLTLEQCITHRKERVAQALLGEITPVLGGQGMQADTTNTGWGVVIDTIEIQNVRVLSEEVFSRLQAPYREALQLSALVAKDKVEQESARLSFERRKTNEQTELEIQTAQHQRKLTTYAQRVEEQSHEASLLQAKDLADQERHEQRRQREVFVAAEELEADLERALRQTRSEEERAQIERQIRREAGVLDAELARMAHDARATLSEAQLRELLLRETLPRMAEAFRGSFEKVSFHHTSGSGAEALAFLRAGLDRLFEPAPGATGLGA